MALHEEEVKRVVATKAAQKKEVEEEVVVDYPRASAVTLAQRWREAASAAAGPVPPDQITALISIYNSTGGATAPLDPKQPNFMAKGMASSSFCFMNSSVSSAWANNKHVARKQPHESIIDTMSASM